MLRKIILVFLETLLSMTLTTLVFGWIAFLIAVFLKTALYVFNF